MANAPLTFPNGNPFKQGKKPAPAKKPGVMDALRGAEKAKSDYRAGQRAKRDAFRSGELAPVKVTAVKKSAPAPAPAKPAAPAPKYGSKADPATAARVAAKYKDAGKSDGLSPVTVAAVKRTPPAPPMPTGRARVPAPPRAAAPRKSAADILGLSEDNAVMKRLRAREKGAR